MLLGLKEGDKYYVVYRNYDVLENIFKLLV